MGMSVYWHLVQTLLAKTCFYPGSCRLSKSFTGIYILLIFIFYHKNVPNQDFIPMATTVASFGQNPHILLQLPETTSPKENAFYTLFSVFVGKNPHTSFVAQKYFTSFLYWPEPTKNASSGNRCRLIPKSALRTWWQLTEGSTESKCLAGLVQDYAPSR